MKRDQEKYLKLTYKCKIKLGAQIFFLSDTQQLPFLQLSLYWCGIAKAQSVVTSYLLVLTEHGLTHSSTMSEINSALGF